MIINEKQKKVNTCLKSYRRKKKNRIPFSVVFASAAWYPMTGILITLLDEQLFFGYDSLKRRDTMERDLQFMDEALRLAREAAAEGEVPVGCVIVRGSEIVGRGRNRRETKKTALGHAELEAIAEACDKLGGWRLWECTLYVTLEPCPMCAGAIVNARIPRVVFGASDAKCGACGSVCNLFSMEFNHHPVVEKGVREEEAAALLSEFFQQLRVTLRSRPKWKKPENSGN